MSGKKSIEKKAKTKTKKLDNGGAVSEPMNYRLITYDVWGNNEDGFYVNNKFKTETMIDVSSDASDEKIIGILKEKGILTDKANKNNIQIDGESDSVLFFEDSERGMPLFELVNETIEKKSNGGNLTGSELLKQEYFKTTAPTQTPAPSESKQDGTNVEVKTELPADVQKAADELKLPDYDTKSDDVLKQHMIGDEIYITHLQNILNRVPKYEEVVGTVKLRKCFLRPYYKKIN
jgi:hypothetical protein